ncbi:MAG TPA: hypothetical protein ENG78_07710 [Acidiferrobacteraceae bacterium]|nr:hypothetical protein [Acidiferrobacteraceae bacterium]HEX20687.1 hypothetical protein [Acidiferrobacteraceae bacterium]
MGLDTTHGCWSGGYISFNSWREKICAVSGLGCLEDYHGFGGSKPWPDDDALSILLYHSDCDGEIEWKDCAAIANRLDDIMPAMKVAGEGGGHIGNYATKTQQFIDGLRLAASKEENVGFH